MPCSYEFRLRVALSPRGDIILTSRIKNIGSDSKPFQFTFAYHTYFSVSDIRYLVKRHSFASCLHQIIAFGVSCTLWVQRCKANKKNLLLYWVMLNLSPSDSIRLQIFKKKELCTRNCLYLNRGLTITSLSCALRIDYCADYQIDLHGPLAYFQFSFSETFIYLLFFCIQWSEGWRSGDLGLSWQPAIQETFYWTRRCGCIRVRSKPLVFCWISWFDAISVPN